MANVNINIRMDSQLKKDFEAFCNDMGLSMTTAFTIFAKKAVREYRIPFIVGVEPPYTRAMVMHEEPKQDEKE